MSAIEMWIGGVIKRRDLWELMDALVSDHMSMDPRFKEIIPNDVDALAGCIAGCQGCLVLYHDGRKNRYSADDVESVCMELGLPFRSWVEEDLDGERSVRYWTPWKCGEDAGCCRVTASRQRLILHEDLWEDLELPYVSVAEMKRVLRERFEPMPAVPELVISEG